MSFLSNTAAARSASVPAAAKGADEGPVGAGLGVGAGLVVITSGSGDSTSQGVKNLSST